MSSIEWRIIDFDGLVNARCNPKVCSILALPAKYTPFFVNLYLYESAPFLTKGYDHTPDFFVAKLSSAVVARAA